MSDNAIILRLAKTLARCPQFSLGSLTSGVKITPSGQSGLSAEDEASIVPTRLSLKKRGVFLNTGLERHLNHTDDTSNDGWHLEVLRRRPSNL